MNFLNIMIFNRVTKTSIQVILIQDIMTKVMITVNPITTKQIAKMMEQVRVGTIFIKENENPIGMMTHRDFATKLPQIVSHLTLQMKK